MTAYEAKRIQQKAKARGDLDRIFKLIKEQAEAGNNELYLRAATVTYDQIELLTDEYNYKIEKKTEHDGYDRNKTLGYWIRW